MNHIIVINKPAGMTSQAVDTKIKKILQVKRVGHLGTLDPLATGVLVVMVGEATKIASFLENDDKSYRATICFGLKTDTLDITGAVLEQKEVKSINIEAFDAALKKFIGQITQTPPIYSALKLNGKKMYEYARKGLEVAVPSREVTIYDLKRSSDLRFIDGCFYVDIDVACSKGTYIRSLIDDIGKRLNIPCSMSALNRLKSGKFGLADSVTIEEVETLQYHHFKMQDALSIPVIEVGSDLANKVFNGMKISPKSINGKFDQVAFTYQGELIGIYQFVDELPEGYHPLRVWNTNK